MKRRKNGKNNNGNEEEKTELTEAEEKQTEITEAEEKLIERRLISIYLFFNKVKKNKDKGTHIQ